MANSNCGPVSLLLVLVTLSAFSLWVSVESLTGGRQDIPGFEHDKKIQDLTKFGVDEYNKQQNLHLVYLKVVKAQSQMVAGTIYYLTIEAQDSTSSSSHLYLAQIWVKEWENFRKLVDFKPVINY